MLTDPSKIVFESTYDVIDYVSKGIVPSRKNFEKVMIAMKSPGLDVHGKNGAVNIPTHIFINCDSETMIDALNRVYENRVRNRNIAIAATATGIIVGGILFRGRSCKGNND